MKTLWIINHYAVTPDLPGETRHFDFAKALVSKGYKVTIFASSFNHLTLREERIRGRETWKEEYYDGVRFVWVKTPPYRRNDLKRLLNVLTFSFRVYFICNALREKPDVIIGSSPHPFAALSSYFIARRKKSLFIFEDRDFWGQTLRLTSTQKIRRKLISFIVSGFEWFLYHKAWRIISVPPGGPNILRRLGINREKVYHIPNGVDISYFQKKDFPLPIELDTFLKEAKDKKHFLVIHTGRIHPTYGLHNLLYAAEILNSRGFRDIHFIFVGEGMDKARLMSIKDKMGLQNIHFFPPVHSNAIPHLLSMCDVGAAIFRKDLRDKILGISSNRLVAYMGSGIPVLAAMDAFNNPVTEAGCCLTVEPENPQAMAEAIISLHRMSEEERKEMGKNGINYVIKNYNIPVLVDKLIRIIEDEG
jgi:glycosyltransferase involved in cell wall biosynthesis